MKIQPLLRQVRRIPLRAIRPSVENPRGEVDRGASFERLVASIDSKGILVPLVVTKVDPPVGKIRYQLVDGERRFRAAQELGLSRVPAHILSGAVASGAVRQLMFHLHMTREQWGPLAQCKSLAVAYPQLARGITLEEKPKWAEKIASDTGMTLLTARDRVHVLSWSKPLKERIYEFQAKQPKTKVYSYVLAIEASIIEPSVRVFPNYYNGSRDMDEAANEVRGSLLQKTITGIESGLLHGRGQIRSVSALFLKQLSRKQKQTALSVFDELVREPSFQFADAEEEITSRLPEVLQETPKPQRVLAKVRTLAAILESFDDSYIDSAEISDEKKQQLRTDLASALERLAAAVEHAKDQV